MRGFNIQMASNARMRLFQVKQNVKVMGVGAHEQHKEGELLQHLDQKGRTTHVQTVLHTDTNRMSCICYPGWLGYHGSGDHQNDSQYEPVVSH